MADEKLHCLDDQLPFELPDGWEWCNFSMIGTTNLGLTYRPTDIEPDEALSYILNQSKRCIQLGTYDFLLI